MIRLATLLLIWLMAAAAPAAVPEAQALWDKGAYRQAIASAFEAANAGDPQAQFILGEAYRFGRAVDPDDLQARDWYLRAARQGDVPSAAALGELLLHMRQSRDAVQWLTLAASHNHARATALLAAIYYTGDGAEQDLVLATSLMKKAAALGSPEAKAKLAMMDDTAPPVDVSSPLPPPAEQASRGAPSEVRVAIASRAPLTIQPAPLTHRTKTARIQALAAIQVGAFRSAINARRALRLVATQTSGESAELSIIRSRGFYKLLLIANGRQSMSAMRTRLVEMGWQHFVRRAGITRV
jgi:hypothetical protein